MTSEEISANEQAIIEICRRLIHELAPQLREKGLRCDQPDVEICQSDFANYCSELSAMIWKGTEIVDVLEFFIIENGRPALSAVEAEEYVRAVLLEALRSSN